MGNIPEDRKMPEDRKENAYPEQGEFVIGTVDNIFRQGAFMTLDEYGKKKGMLHLSEISLKWVRNIRDYVKEGQKVVLVVLRADPQRGHIDLSLRRVTDSQRKLKLQEVKQRQRSESLLKLLADELGEPHEEIREKIGTKLTDNLDMTLYEAFETIVMDGIDSAVLNSLEIDNEWKDALVTLVQKNIKAPFVKIDGYVELKSYESDGVNTLKESLKRIKDYTVDGCDTTVSYVSAPLYRVHVKARDYKLAERALKESADEGIAYMKKHQGFGEFYRKMDDKK